MSSFETRDQIQHLIARLNELPSERREALLGNIPDLQRVRSERVMLTQEQVGKLRRSGFTIGSHGKSHTPMKLVGNAMGDLSASRDELRAMSGTEVTALSFPHGSYDETLLKSAAAAGYRLAFTSDPWVHTAVAGQDPRGTCRILGRIPIRTSDVTDTKGQFSPAKMAGWLFRRGKFRPEMVHANARN